MNSTEIARMPQEEVHTTRLALTCDAQLPIQAILDFAATHSSATASELLFVVDMAVEADPMRRVLELTGFDTVDADQFSDRIKRDGYRGRTAVFLVGTPEYAGMARVRRIHAENGITLHTQEYLLDLF